jgi:acetyl esterase/lipase
MKVPVTLPVLLVFAFLLAPNASTGQDTKPAKDKGETLKVKVVKDIAYNDAKDADPAKHKLDLYVPEDKKDFPVLFFVHGGGWRQGDRKIYPWLGTMFAKHGIGTVIISYRLSPKVKHPTHIQDVAKAFAWTHKNISKYGGKADQIFISGHSAGGHLVALLATDPSYLKAEGLTIADIKGALPLSGVYMIRPDKRWDPIFGTDAEVLKKASPMEHIKGKLPPFLIAYASKEEDKPIGKMSEQFGKALKEAKCDAAVLKIDDRDHITIIRKAITDADDPLTQAMLKFIAKHSGPKLEAKKVSD